MESQAHLGGCRFMVRIKSGQVIPRCKLTLKPYFSDNYQSLSPATMKTLDEADVGILCYISNLPGFRGILKQRYSDFIVNEVDLDEKVVHLTSLEVPDEMVQEKEIKVSDEPRTSYCAEVESFRALAGDSNADSLKTFLDQINSVVDDGIDPIILSPSSDKVHRTEIHNFFKERLKFLVTDTVDGPDPLSKCIRVRLDAKEKNGRGGKSRKRKGRGDKPFDSRGSENWPEHLGKFLRFHLYKENKDTQEALGLIGKMLGIQPRSFGFSGTKDKRSVSTQRVTVFKQRASRLAALNERLIGIKVGDFCHVEEGLLLGQLYGNRFTITLRGVVADSEDTIKASAEALGKLGFINYFGLQRFGSGSVPTHLIGAELLKGEWKAAVNMILDPREGEKDAIRKLREYYKESDDIAGTLRQLPRYLVAERAILQCLMKCPGNYLQALKSIPRTLRMMYVHSYQSYLWNHAASMRVQNYGIDKVISGDLVYSKDGSSAIIKQVPNFGGEEDSINDEFGFNHLDEIAETDIPEERSTLVKIVNEEDIASGNYTIEDVLLPLPGSKVIYPLNDIGKIYQELADKDGISLTDNVHSTKEFSLTSMTGAYRRVFQKLKDFKWELLTYTDGSIPLSVTDLDIIMNSKRTSVVDNERVKDVTDSNICRLHSGSPGNDAHDPALITEAKIDGEAGQVSRSTAGLEAQIALKMAFTLPASCYATMAIRELLKTSTSVAFHKTLNQ